jgi:hypothetical protein
MDVVDAVLDHEGSLLGLSGERENQQDCGGLD